MKPIKAIKQFFEDGPHGRRVTMDELKQLDKDERDELGRLACEAMGVEFEGNEA